MPVVTILHANSRGKLRAQGNGVVESCSFDSSKVLDIVTRLVRAPTFKLFASDWRGIDIGHTYITAEQKGLESLIYYKALKRDTDLG